MPGTELESVLAKIAAKLPAGLPADLKSTFASVGDGGRLPTDVWSAPTAWSTRCPCR